MKRKVAKIGPSTLMISLPSKWVKIHGIKQGDELEVIENNAELVVRSDSRAKIGEKTIDIEEMDNMVYRLVGALYKRGYSNVKLLFHNNKQLQSIYKVLSDTCIGLEILDNGKGYVTLKQVAETSQQEFSNIVRRLFIFLTENVNNSVEAVKNLNVDELNNLILNDKNINRYSDLARRLINSRILQNSPEGPLYYIVEQLEKIGDDYRDLFKHAIEMRIKIDGKLLALYKEVSELLSHFYRLFYTFNFKSLEEFYIKNSAIKTKIKTMWDELPKKELRVLFYLENIHKSIFDLNGSVMTNNL
ncbi:MAG TPA: phosphate uptake regulator PhoU [Candidatus Nanoarchaeia archaeon]|nr:phosphate uptake regulator PhoU [Candidatus Nanoarchaeia archaeon]